jgi:hypothetical protein
LACLVVFIILIFVSEVPSGQDDHCQQDGPKSSSFVYVPVLCGHKDTSAFDLSSIKFASRTRTSQDQFWYRAFPRSPSQYRHLSAKHTAFAARLWHTSERRISN